MQKDILHLKAPGNWINDPNGFIYYKGQYHLFYQYFPYAPEWGTMHWGHAVSSDLIHWEHKGVALYPSKEYDKNGVFSGNALVKEGKLQLYYTAVRYLGHKEGNIHLPLNDQYESSQAMVISEDGEHFDNIRGKQQMIPVCRDEAIGHPKHSKDPKVIKTDRGYLMILGSSLNEEIGMLSIFESQDAANWKWSSVTKDRDFGKIVECPDLIRLGDQCVIEYCGMFAETAYDGESVTGYPHLTYWKTVKFDENCGTITPYGQRHLIDYGEDLYAAESTTDADGRPIMVAWVRMPEAVHSEDRGEWNGMICQVRVLDFHNNHLHYHVHPAIRAFFSTERKMSGAGMPRRFRLTTVLLEGESLNIGGYAISLRNGRIVADRTGLIRQESIARRICRTPEIGASASLEIFVDDNLIETFVDDGKYVITHVLYGLSQNLSGKYGRIFTSNED
jgi:beta-fructofuranosidase